MESMGPSQGLENDKYGIKLYDYFLHKEVDGGLGRGREI